MLRTTTIYGLIIAASLIAYFLLMKLLGLHQYPALSIVNAFLFGGGIYRAIRTYRRDHPNNEYLDAWQVGILSGATATIIFTGFMAVYMYQIDSVFANQMLASWSINYNTGVLIMLLSMVLMGFSTTMVCVLSFMQLFKTSWNTTKTARVADSRS
ncbi:MAG: DUF4199 domain-containing protein [Flavobacteriaceae bacterium]|nr:DUF4199 domain-containing protein [Flavobacteriaceae bacterium]